MNVSHHRATLKNNQCYSELENLMCCETLLFSGIFSNPQKFLDIEYLEQLTND
jgi:hypothetical protein